MNVDAALVKHKSEHDGKNYVFCCAGCAEKFMAEPSKYLSQSTGLTTISDRADARYVAEQDGFPN